MGCRDSVFKKCSVAPRVSHGDVKYDGAVFRDLIALDSANLDNDKRALAFDESPNLYRRRDSQDSSEELSVVRVFETTGWIN
jgi:hypothetical protein